MRFLGKMKFGSFIMLSRCCVSRRYVLWCVSIGCSRVFSSVEAKASVVKHWAIMGLYVVGFLCTFIVM